MSSGNGQSHASPSPIRTVYLTSGLAKSVLVCGLRISRCAMPSSMVNFCLIPGLSKSTFEGDRRSQGIETLNDKTKYRSINIKEVTLLLT